MGVDYKSPKINQKWATFENMELAENLTAQGYNFTNFAPILLLYMSKFTKDQALQKNTLRTRLLQFSDLLLPESCEMCRFQQMCTFRVFWQHRI